MTKETIEALQKFERPLRTSLAGYARISPQEMRELLKEVYGEDWQLKVKKSVMTCSGCKLQELQKIARMYFNEIQQQQTADTDEA